MYVRNVYGADGNTLQTSDIINLIVSTLTVDRREAKSRETYSLVELTESSVTPVIEPQANRQLDTHAGTVESGPGIDGDVRREAGTVLQTGHTVFVDFERLHDVTRRHVIQQQTCNYEDVFPALIRLGPSFVDHLVRE